MEEAAGRYIAFLDSDDLWKKDRLSAELAFMKVHQAGFVFSGYEFADESGKGTGRVVRAPENSSYRQALKNTTIFTLYRTVRYAYHYRKELLRMPLVKSEDTAARVEHPQAWVYSIRTRPESGAVPEKRRTLSSAQDRRQSVESGISTAGWKGPSAAL